MSRRSKILLMILLPILAVFGMMYFLIDAVYVPAKEPIIFPTGSLQASIFVEQNNHYTESDELKQEYEFKKVPYKANIPESDGAIIGDAATVYQINDKVFVYFTEYDDSMDVKQVILSQFPAAMLITYEPDRTTSLLHEDRKGYINGFAANYLAMSIEASDGRNIEDAVVLGYALDVPEVEYAGKHMFVGIGTTELTTAALESCMVVIPTLKDVGGSIESVSVAEKDFAARLNSAGNIVIDYSGDAYDAKHLNMGTLTLDLKISGIDEPVTLKLKRVKAKKTNPAVNPGMVKVTANATVTEDRPVATANIVSTYTAGAAGRRILLPVKTEIVGTPKNITVRVNENDPTEIDIFSLNSKNTSVKVKLTFDSAGLVTKTVTLRVKKKT